MITNGLSEIRNQLDSAALSAIEMQSTLRQAMFDAISEADVAAIVKKQVEKAKAGDVNAAKFVLANVIGAASKTTIRQTNIVTDVATAARLARDIG